METFVAQRKRICEIGKRIYDKGFVSANEGNVSIRVSDNRVLITPTMRSKGFLSPADICEIDFDGTPRDAATRPSSEFRLHLNVYRQRPDIFAVVHSHPPHATAFAIAREPVPNGVLPEPDIFLGPVPMAPFETPGNQKFADTILPYIKSTDVIVLASHGTLTCDADLERAFWKTEVLDSYCRMLILAKQIGHVELLTDQQQSELAGLRKSWGFEIRDF